MGIYMEQSWQTKIEETLMEVRHNREQQFLNIRKLQKPSSL